MAKKSAIEKNKRRMRMVDSKGGRREALRNIIKNKNLPLEDRFAASLKMSEEPRDSSPSRVRNRTAPVKYKTFKPRSPKMLFDKSLSSRPLSSPRHSDEAPPPSENASDAPPARPRAVSDDEKRSLVSCDLPPFGTRAARRNSPGGEDPIFPQSRRVRQRPSPRRREEFEFQRCPKK